MKIFTIGFTKTTAERFFNRLKKSGAIKLIDVRLNNVSQLAGFAKRDDLRYFFQEICSTSYMHEPRLAPTKELLDRHKKLRGSSDEYERDFLNLIEQRHIENIEKSQIDGGCLLCSEDTCGVYNAVTAMSP